MGQKGPWGAFDVLAAGYPVRQGARGTRTSSMGATSSGAGAHGKGHRGGRSGGRRRARRSGRASRSGARWPPWRAGSPKPMRVCRRRRQASTSKAGSTLPTPPSCPPAQRPCSCRRRVGVGGEGDPHRVRSDVSWEVPLPLARQPQGRRSRVRRQQGRLHALDDEVFNGGNVVDDGHRRRRGGPFTATETPAARRATGRSARHGPPDDRRGRSGGGLLHVRGHPPRRAPRDPGDGRGGARLMQRIGPPPQA